MGLCCQSDKQTFKVLKGSLPKPEGYPETLSTIGDHIKAMRLDKGLFQADLALQIGVTEETICNWEQNKHEPKITLYPTIIGFLGYHPNTSTEKGSIRLRNFRESKGLTLKDLAEKINSDEKTIIKGEKGNEDSAQYILQKILRLF